MTDVEIRACFPNFRKELLVESGFKITDAFGSAGATLCTDHALNHLDVMRAPEREVFIVFEHHFCKLKLFVSIFEVSHDLEHGARALIVVLFLLRLIGIRGAQRCAEATALQDSIKTLCQRWTRHARLQAFVRKLIPLELAQNS